VIKIVYRDLSPGLHAFAEAKGRNTVISLLPGLTPEQRRAALRRIRHSGRMGHGPQVPSGKLTVALALDRMKAAARTCAAVVRLHPAGSTLPVVFFSVAAVIFVLMATVSIHVLPAAPRSSGQEPVVGGVTPVPVTSAPVSQGLTSPGGSRGGASRMDTGPGRLAVRQLSSPGISAAGSGGLPPSAQVSGAGPTGSSASQAAGTGSTSAGTGTSPAGSSGSPQSTGSSVSSGSGGTSGSGGAGSGGPVASGSSGSGGSSGSASAVPGSSGSAGSSGSGTGSGSGSGDSSGSGGSGSGGSGSGSAGGGNCVTILSVAVCVGL